MRTRHPRGRAGSIRATTAGEEARAASGRASVLVAFVALALAGGLALLTLLTVRSTPAEGRRAASALSDVAPITERLDRIESALDRLARRLERDGPSDARLPSPLPAPGGETRDGDAGPAPEARAPEGDTERILAALLHSTDSLRAELQGVRETIREEAVRGQAVSRIRDLGGEVAWHAWEPILELWDRDRDAARQEVKLLTDVEVLDRFGPPTDVWSNTNGITWQYARDLDPVTGDPGTEVILRMPAGFVTQLAVRRNAR